jgi:hypothetical protein
MKRAIRLLVILAAAGAAAAARAQVKVADSIMNGEGVLTGLDYGVSTPFDRAWLVLHYTFTGPCSGSEGECSFDEPRKVHLDGLTYDTSAKEVVYSATGAAPVVCATVQSHGSREVVKATGRCGYTVNAFERFVDDGYSGQVVHGKEVFFQAKAPRTVATR